MADPMSADAFLRILRAEGLAVTEVGDWRNHNRNHMGPWGPVHGVMIHHTVTKGSAYTVDLCRRGHGDLPGPLCHGVITKDGKVHLVGYGRANHAGLGDPDVLNAVKAESYMTNPPADNEANTDGNPHFYGFECENLGNGEDPWPAAQLEAIEKASAAICRYHGWGEKSVIGHLEWQPGKIDPRGFTMASMRARIKDRLAGGQQEEEDMDLTAANLKDIAKAVLTTDGIIDNPNPATAGSNSHISLESAVRNIEIVARRTEQRVSALETTGLTAAQIDAIATRVADVLAARMDS